MFEDKTMEIFSSRDMIRQQLINYAENYLELNNIDLTKQSYLSYLINIMSVLTSNLIYYNTATYREFFLVRAHQKESVLNLAAMLGYRPEVAIPSTAQVLVSIPTNFKSSTHLIMRGRHDSENEAFKFYATNDIVFSCENEINVDIIMDRGRFLVATVTETNKDTGGVRALNWRLTEDRQYLSFLVNVTQVEDQFSDFNFPVLRPYQYYTQTINFKGDFAGISVSTTTMEKEIRTIFDENLNRWIQDTYDRETTDAIEWEEASSLFLVSPGEYKYTYRINENGLKLFFGNGIIGTQPTSESKCSVVVSVTKGYDGNVIAGSINTTDKLYCDVTVDGVVRTLPVNIKCINPSASLGGQSYPTIDEIRSRAITQVSTNKRLVSEYDFKNASDVVADLPIQHSTPILKRSDLKRNEICLYTDIVFGNEYVPTKNAVIKIPSGQENYPIRYRDLVTLDLNRYETEDDYSGMSFVSMFDIQLDTTARTCQYFYTVSDYETETILKKTWNNITIFYPQSAKFNVLRDSTSSENDILSVTFYYTKTSNSSIYNDLRCYLEIDESGEYLDMTSSSDSSGNTYFYIEKSLNDITEGNLNFDFQVKYYDSTNDTESWICLCNSSTVVKQSLDDFMYSKVKKYSDGDADSENGAYWGILYDVPTILKEYMDQLDENNQSDNFIEQVLHRIVTFDVSEYKMLTDFVNLKFSNTFGLTTNMNHNLETRGVVNRIDPEEIPSSPGDGYTCIVTNNKNAWNGSPWFRTTGGFIARYSSYTPGNWVFTNLQTNDIVLYHYIPEGQLFRSPELSPGETYSTKLGSLNARDRLPRLLYNGDNLFTMTKNIPLEIEIDIWKDPNVSISDSGIIDSIKTSLINNFISKMGYDKPIYISEITKIVQEVSGVDYCRVLKPYHDLFFNYDFTKFKQEDLLRYSPQLIYFDTNSIEINIRKRNDLR